MNLIKDPICQSICTMLAPRLRSLEAWPAANPWQRRLLRRRRHLSEVPRMNGEVAESAWKMCFLCKVDEWIF